MRVATAHAELPPLFVVGMDAQTWAFDRRERSGGRRVPWKDIGFSAHGDDCACGVSCICGAVFNRRAAWLRRCFEDAGAQVRERYLTVPLRGSGTSADDGT